MENLKAYSASQEGNQIQVAQSFGITQSYLSLLMAGKKKPSLQLAALIERVTGGEVPMSSWVSIELDAQSETAA